MRSRENGRIIGRNDVILIAAAVAAALLFLLLRGGEPAATVVIESHGAIVAELPLGTDAEYPVAAAGVYNLVRIEDGEAYIADANCRDKLCVGHRPVSSGGESIICLPNKLVVTAYSRKQSGIDAVAG
ncbi:MAG: NusG domain II-containing protein [Oscillospiraceae bacterium]|nr:NusG domain II-containing protein [Oscillospiraceae bacterium]